jgi:PAS domain S-box-containing protein
MDAPLGQGWRFFYKGTMMKSKPGTLSSEAGDTEPGQTAETPRENGDGEVAYFDGIVEDITQRKRAEDLIRSLIHTAPSVILCLSPEGRILEFNPEAERLYGRKRDDVLGQNYLELFLPQEAREPVLKNINKALAGASSRGYENPVKAADGSERILTWNVDRLLDNQGRPMGIIAIGQDITERVRMEDELRKRETHRALVLSSLPMAFYTAQPFGDYGGTWVSEQIYRISGYTAEQFSADIHLWASRLHPEDRERVLDEFGKLLDEGIIETEYRWQTAHGRYSWLLDYAVLIRDDNGEPKEIIGTWLDITERKQAQEELEEYHERLEALVKERTRELEETQAELLRQERLSTLGQLTATIAHEIRNPLGTIRTAIFTIGDAIERDQVERIGRALQVAERNIVRCDRIISELLDYAHDRTLKPRRVHIDTWLDAVLDRQHIPQDIVCTRALNCGVEAMVDHEHLRRAVINVINNALDALRDDAATGNQLTVSTHVVKDQAGSRLEMRIGDTGPGIPGDVLDKIFDPLFSTKSFGIGMGLPIVKNIMERHHGGVEVQSVKGQGTTVILWLPI